MAWKVEVAPAAEKELDKLDPQHAKRILDFLHKRLAKLEDPRSIGAVSYTHLDVYKRQVLEKP